MTLSTINQIGQPPQARPEQHAIMEGRMGKASTGGNHGKQEAIGAGTRSGRFQIPARKRPWGIGQSVRERGAARAETRSRP